jgi:ABC-2 type transport system ATP-binding protein
VQVQTAEPAIRTRGLTKRYGDFTAVDHLDLEVARGEIFGLLGPNGAGKTTTILMLLGLSEPSAGQARVVGLDPTRQPLEVKRRVGYLPDNVGFYSDLTGRQNLMYTARLNGIATGLAEGRIADVLRKVGLSQAADARVGTYSKGMRQRLGVADALVKDPEVLVLDEPTIALDPEAVQETLDLIRELPQAGVAVLLSSHLLHQVQAVCDRVAIFVDGKVVALGRVDELAAQLGGARISLELGVAGAGSPEEILRRVPGVEAVEAEGELWMVHMRRDVRAEVVRALGVANFELTHLRRRGAELDDIYRRYFSGRDADGDAS